MEIPNLFLSWLKSYNVHWYTNMIAFHSFEIDRFTNRGCLMVYVHSGTCLQLYDLGKGHSDCLWVTLLCCTGIKMKKMPAKTWQVSYIVIRYLYFVNTLIPNWYKGHSDNLLLSWIHLDFRIYMYYYFWEFFNTWMCSCSFHWYIKIILKKSIHLAAKLVKVTKFINTSVPHNATMNKVVKLQNKCQEHLIYM